MKARLGLILSILVCLRLVGILPMHQQVSADETSLEKAVAKSVQEIGKTTWFDPETQSIVPVPLKPTQTDTVHRDSRWLPSAKKIPQPSTGNPSTSPGWFNTNVTTANLIGWLILGLAFLVIAAAVLYSFSKITPETMLSPAWQSTAREEHASEQILTRIQELPAELRRTNVDLRAEAERLMNTGNLDDAIKCLFGHQLLVLDRCGFLRLSRGKTNGRYVGETKTSKPEAGFLLSSTAAAFEASYFGRHTPTTSAFHDLWESNVRLESLARRDSEFAR